MRPFGDISHWLSDTSENMWVRHLEQASCNRLPATYTGAAANPDRRAVHFVEGNTMEQGRGQNNMTSDLFIFHYVARLNLRVQPQQHQQTCDHVTDM